MDDDIPNPVDYYGQTVINPAALAITVLMGILTLTLPRRYALWPMAIIVCFVAPAQRIYVLSANFTLLRIMVVFGWTRLLVKRELFVGRWLALDFSVIAWALCYAALYTAERQTLDALVFTLGEIFDALGLYFLFRALVRNWDDLNSVITGFAVLSIPVAVCFIIENRTGHNPFAFLGGVPYNTMIREGRLRCQGAFSHPIMAGSFWVALIPLFVSQWWKPGQRRWLVGVAVGCALLIVFLCASSGPIGGLFLALIAGLMFPLRRWMRPVRWLILLTLVVLQMTLQSPVWHLISHIDFVGGSTGWYRYILMDQAIHHFGQWWAMGTLSTHNWGGEGLALDDITNQYILEGVRAGILCVALFVAGIALAFRCVGKIWRASGSNKAATIQGWALGVTLFVHVITFFSVSYFGQTIMVWYLLLAAIGSLCVMTEAQRRLRKTVVARRPAARPAIQQMVPAN